MNLINNNLILLDHLAANKDDVIQTLANLANLEDRLNDKELFIKELYHREEEAPTNVGFFTAIPHGRTDAVKEATLMFIRLKKDIPWNDDQVHMIFGIAVPEEAGRVHLAMLAKIARKIMKEEFRSALDNASTCDEIVALLED